MRSSVNPFSFVKIQNPNPKPGFDLVQTRNPGLEKDVRFWNPYHKHGYRESFIVCLLNTVVQQLYLTFGKWNRFSCIQDKW